ncbi:hypothetical protein D3C73_767580 [compost metagenome]
MLGDNQARIMGVSLLDGQSDEKITMVEPGQLVKLCLKIRANDDIELPIVGFSINDRLGNTIAQSNSYVLEEMISEMLEEKVYGFVFEFPFPTLNHGQYSISPAVASGSQEEHVQHSWVHDALVIQVPPVQKHQLDGLLVMDDVKFYSLD